MSKVMNQHSNCCISYYFVLFSYFRIFSQILADSGAASGKTVKLIRMSPRKSPQKTFESATDKSDKIS